MIKQLIYGLIFLLLFGAFFLLFWRIRFLETVSYFYRRGRSGMEEMTKRRLLENRRQLLTLQKENSFWYKLEQQLNYSGLKRWFPYVSAEMWIVFFLVFHVGFFLLASALFGILKGLLITVAMFVLEYVSVGILKLLAFRSVNANLIKFLDFLGNYSITSGELTGVFNQISKYMDEPLQTVLEECSYEAQTTGDSSLALLVMAEKIEHPKFKELTRNMEISVRYSADFTMLVNSSRKNIREYLRLCEEQKGVIREAAINMLLLMAMSAVTLVVVNGLIEVSIWTILWKTWPGRIAIGCIVFICFLFLKKAYRINH